MSTTVGCEVLQPSLLNAAQAINFSHWAITLRLDSDAILEANKGNILHGGFGRALAKISSALYDQLFAQQGQNNRKASPFMLYCLDNTQRHYLAGQQLTIELRLFAADEAVLNGVRQAFIAWQALGLGEDRSSFSLLQIINNQGALLYSAELGELIIPSQCSIAEILQQRLKAFITSPFPQGEVFYRLVTQSRCRIQRHGMPIKTVPDLDIWLNAITRRFMGLLPEDYPLERITEIRKGKPEQHAMRVVFADAHFSDWQKYSVKDKRMVNIGGLIGQWHYANIDLETLQWLVLGEYIGIGNKTSFGFGCYVGYLGYKTC